MLITTSAQAYSYFLLLFRKENQGTVPPEEFNAAWNAAQIDYLNAKAEGTDENQRLRDVFRVLVPPPLTILNTGGTAPETEVFQLPYVDNPAPGQSHGYWRALNVAFRLESTPGVLAPCGDPSGWTLAFPLPRDSRLAVQNDPFAKPTDEEPYYVFTERTIRCWTGSTTFASQLRIEYLRYPVMIDVNDATIAPELPAHINKEITTLAVRSHLEVIQDPRYQTRLTEEKTHP